MIQIILEEADDSIQKSYYEGYKQANIELLPQISSLKNQLESYQKAKLSGYITSAAIGFGLGCLTGTTIGFAVQIKLN